MRKKRTEIIIIKRYYKLEYRDLLYQVNLTALMISLAFSILELRIIEDAAINAILFLSRSMVGLSE